MNSYTDPPAVGFDPAQNSLNNPTYQHHPQQLPYQQFPMATQQQNLARSTVKDGLQYRLEIGQQPQRARMCGFGDKDRRPITPPPCIRLVISDANTGRELDFNEIEGTYFIMLVDLWDEHASQESNLVRHSSTTPSVSISLASTTRFPPPQEPQQQYMQMHGGYPPRPMGPYGYPPPGHPQDPYYGQVPPMYGYPQAPNMAPVAPRSTAEMYTRNLIGSNTVNAFKLVDTNDKVGYWFVLQDLSVRTEGVFRLKLNLFKLGNNDNTLTNTNAPCLASVFSEPFQVWSAKKFPGVMDSTALSKCFAAQGIKIPIRKDGARGLSNQNDYDDDM